MTTDAIKQAAINFECKVYSFRKTKDGTVIAFVVHPNDVSDKLSALDIGDRLLIAAVPLADEE